MDYALLVNDLNSLDQLDGNVQASPKVKLPSAILELIFETLSQEIHDHDVIHFAIFRFLVAYEVQVRNCRFSSEFVNQLGLPEEHYMLGVLHGFLHLGSQEVSSLPLLDFVDISEGTTSKFLDDLIPLVENLLAFFHFVFFKSIINFKFIIYFISNWKNYFVI